MNSIEQLRSLKTLTYREIRRFFRIWQQALIPSVITTMLYFVIFGSFIGSRIGSMGGFEYMQFMAPGLIMLAVITNSYSNVVSSFYGNKFSRSLEELLVSEYVWLKMNNSYRPVILKDSSITRKTHLNDKLIQYTIKVEETSPYLANLR